MPRKSACAAQTRGYVGVLKAFRNRWCAARNERSQTVHEIPGQCANAATDREQRFESDVNNRKSERVLCSDHVMPSKYCRTQLDPASDSSGLSRRKHARLDYCLIPYLEWKNT